MPANQATRSGAGDLAHRIGIDDGASGIEPHQPTIVGRIGEGTGHRAGTVDVAQTAPIGANQATVVRAAADPVDTHIAGGVAVGDLPAQEVVTHQPTCRAATGNVTRGVTVGDDPRRPVGRNQTPVVLRVGRTGDIPRRTAVFDAPLVAHHQATKPRPAQTDHIRRGIAVAHNTRVGVQRDQPRRAGVVGGRHGA